MEWLFGTGVAVGMTVLRLAVPVILTALLVRLVRQLDARWHQTAANV